MKLLQTPLLLFIVLACSCNVAEKSKPRKAPAGVLAVLNDTTEFAFNKDYQKRDKILGFKTDWKTATGGIAYFESLTIEQLDELLLNRFIDPGEYQNESPTTKDFYQFMSKFPMVVAHGYATSPDREDYRVTIEGLFAREADVNDALKKEFHTFCHEADEYEDAGDLYSWWD